MKIAGHAKVAGQDVDHIVTSHQLNDLQWVSENEREFKCTHYTHERGMEEQTVERETTMGECIAQVNLA